MNSNSHEAHYRTFCIPLFLPPSHIKYSPHHPALTNHQSVIFSWHQIPNFTPTQNDSNTVSTIDQYMCILNRMLASIVWTYPPIFSPRSWYSSNFVWLQHILNQTHNKVTVALNKQCDIKYKLLQTLPYGLLTIHSPQSNRFMNTDYHRRKELWLYVKCE